MTIATRVRDARRAGDDEMEFRRFVIAFSPTLVRAAVLLLRDREAAQDAVQTTLERTFRRWRVARVAPEAYSRRVLVNVCRNHWRHERRHPVAAARDEPPEATDRSAARAGIEDRLMLEAALTELPELHREVIVARFFLDLSVAETADLLKVPPGTVKSATHRGLGRLRTLLTDHTLEVPHARITG